MEKFAQLVVSGVAVGGIYAMAALGFVLVFKATRILNFAQGSLMMVGGYVGLAAATTFGLPVLVAFVVAAVVLAGMGALIYGASLRPVGRRGGNTEFAQVIITMGWTVILGALVQFLWGPVTRRFPAIFPSGSFEVAAVRISYIDVGTIGLTLLVVLAFTMLFRFTRYGLLMRGLADNRQAAVMLGASEARANLGAWALAGAAAAVAGLTLTSYSPLGLTFPELAMLAFPAVVLGGIDSIPGGLAGGVAIGVVQQLAGGYIDPAFGQTAGFILMLAVLMIRPNGLFGSAEVVRL